MKKAKILIPVLSIAGMGAVVAPMVTSCGGGGNTPTGDRTNKISWGFKESIITYSDTFNVNMTLEKELASGQKITGVVTSFSGTTGGSALAVTNVTTSGKTATVTFKYGIAPFTEGRNKFTVKFTGSTNGTEEWSNTIADLVVFYSK